MKILVINLPESSWRREVITGQLHRLGLDYELIPAVNGHKLSAEQIEQLCDRQALETYPDWLTKGAIGKAKKFLEKHVHWIHKLSVGRRKRLYSRFLKYHFVSEQ